MDLILYQASYILHYINRHRDKIKKINGFRIPELLKDITDRNKAHLVFKILNEERLKSLEIDKLQVYIKKLNLHLVLVHILKIISMEVFKVIIQLKKSIDTYIVYAINYLI